MTFIADQGATGRRRADLRSVRAHPGRVVHGRAPGRRSAHVQPVYPATAWGVDPLAFDGNVSFSPAGSRAGGLVVPADLARQRDGRPLLVPGAGGVGRRLPCDAPGSRPTAPRCSAGSGDGRGAAVSRRAPGDERWPSAPWWRAASAGHVLYPAWLAWRTRGGRGGPGAAPPPVGSGHGARPDRPGAGLQGVRGDRRQGRRPPGQRVSRLAGGPGRGRRRSRDRRGRGAGRAPVPSPARSDSASPRPSTGASPRPRRRSS